MKRISTFILALFLASVATMSHAAMSVPHKLSCENPKYIVIIGPDGAPVCVPKPTEPECNGGNYEDPLPLPDDCRRIDNEWYRNNFDY